MADGFASFANTTDFDTSHTNLMSALTELSNLHTGASEPTNKHDGMLWHDTGNNQIKVYDLTNTTWRVLVQDIEDANCGLAALAGATFTGVTGGVESTGDAHFPISSQINDRTLSMVFDVTLGNATENFFLWSVPASSKYEVSEVYIISDTATTGSDGSNNLTFQVANLTAANNLIASATTTNGSEITANTRYALGIGQNNQKADLSGGDVIELQITKTGTPTDLSGARVIVQVDYKVALF